MNVSKEQIDDLNIVLSVQVSNDDYQEKVVEVLREYRRKANMPGFRPGKIPEGLIRKMYGKGVLIDEINKIIPDALEKYIKEQELKILGELLPIVNTDEMDWEVGNDFTFSFEVGLSPEIGINLSKEDHLPKYKIIVEQEVVDKNIDNYLKRFGQFVDVATVVDFQEKLTGDIVQLGNDGQSLPDGLSAEDTTLYLMNVKEDELKIPFENAREGDEIEFNLSATFPNEWEMASILKKKDKAGLGDVTASLFRFTVKNIQNFVNAELNQELFDKVFGAGTVSNPEEFENRVRKNIESVYEENCMSKFNDDARQYLLENINPPLPEDFLRKWLLSTNKEIVGETFEKEFPVFLKTMKWELIVNAIIKKYELNVEEQEIVNFAKYITGRHLSSYGMNNISDEDMNNYATNYLKEEKNVRDVVAQILQKKATSMIHATVDLQMQEISFNDFNQMMYEASNKMSEAVEEEQ